MPGMRLAVAAMSSVHEEVNDRAEEQEGIRQEAENVSSVLLEEKEDRDGQEETEPQPHWDVKGLASCLGFSCGVHGSSCLSLTLLHPVKGKTNAPRPRQDSLDS